MDGSIVDKVNTSASSGVGEVVSVADTKPMKGAVKIYVEELGVNTLVWDDPNLIVDGARKALTHLIAAGDANYKVSTIKLGTKGHNLTTGNLLDPVAPKVSDTGLIDTTTAYAETISSSGNGITYQGTGDTSVKFSVVLEKTEGNGTGTVAYTEAGLFCANGTLFARETFPAIVKNANRRITFEWTILF